MATRDRLCKTDTMLKVQSVAVACCLLSVVALGTGCSSKRPTISEQKKTSVVYNPLVKKRCSDVGVGPIDEGVLDPTQYSTREEFIEKAGPTVVAICQTANFRYPSIVFAQMFWEGGISYSGGSCTMGNIGKTNHALFGIKQAGENQDDWMYWDGGVGLGHSDGGSARAYSSFSNSVLDYVDWLCRYNGNGTANNGTYYETYAAGANSGSNGQEGLSRLLSMGYCPTDYSANAFATASNLTMWDDQVKVTGDPKSSKETGGFTGGSVGGASSDGKAEKIDAMIEFCQKIVDEKRPYVADGGGGPQEGFDAAGFVSNALVAGGFSVGVNWTADSGNTIGDDNAVAQAMKLYAWKEEGSVSEVEPETGDVLWYPGHHMAIVVAPGQIAHAHGSDTGGSEGIGITSTSSVVDDKYVVLRYGEGSVAFTTTIENCENDDGTANADTSGGAAYHQTQANNSNCGATSFTIAVNMLLGQDDKYDNLAVWSSSAFGSDSTVNVPGKGAQWLKDNNLDSKISCSDASINSPEELKAQLQQGHVVVISSGDNAPFIYLDGSSSYYSAGHFVCVYRYANGVYYVNDPAKGSDISAGVGYTEAQMKAWFDGRPGHHPCAVLARK